MIGKFGKVYLVGAGPGRPDFITLAGLRALKKADVVFYDHLVHPDVLKYCRKSTQLVNVGKKEHGSKFQTEIEKYLIIEARKGLTVVRLKGGDPFVFGRGGEEALALATAGIEYEVINGVSSVYSVPASIGIPLTHRESTSEVALITGHEALPVLKQQYSFEAIAKMRTIVIVMGSRNLKVIAAELMRCGLDPQTPSAFIQWGTWEGQREVIAPISQLASYAQKFNLGSPATVIIGKGVSLSQRLDQKKRTWLSGRKILMARAEGLTSHVAAKLRQYGAEVVERSVLKIVPLELPSVLLQKIQKTNYDFILFSSRHAVDMAFQKKLIQKAHLQKSVFVVVGPSSESELKKYKPKNIVCVDEANQKGMIDYLKKQNLKSKNIFFPGAQNVLPALPQFLKKSGAKADIIPIYGTEENKSEIKKARQEISQKKYTDLLLASSNVAASLFEKASLKLPKDLLLISLGPVTAKEIKRQYPRHSFQVMLSSLEPSVMALELEQGRQVEEL